MIFLVISFRICLADDASVDEMVGELKTSSVSE